MKRRIKAFGEHYHNFMQTLDEKEKLKMKYIVSLLETGDRMPLKFMKFIRDGIYELRMEYNSNIYRLFFIFDDGNVVILFNGFQKKTQKTPENEIEKALKLKKAYYEQKQDL
jgi:putative addiction module killer protein